MLQDAFAPLVDLIYPPRCPLCGEGIGAQTGMCAPCWSEIVMPPDPACRFCQGPLSMDDDADEGGDEYAADDGDERAPPICSSCRYDPPIHDGITAATLYTQASRRLVVSFKHGRKIGLAPLLARLIAARLPDLTGPWLVIPVPLHRWRLWQRGFNQSALIAKEIARIRGYSGLVDGLVRRKNTASLSQSRLGRAERARLMADAIAVNPARAAAIADAQVLLVDDVLTSGATTDACCTALRAAGARTVRIACFARVPDENR